MTKRRLVVALAAVAVLPLIYLRVVYPRRMESLLKNDLFFIRATIDEYTFDKHKGPHNLRNLVSEGYMHQIPVDPMTKSADTWKLIMEDPQSSIDPNAPGIIGVHSGSSEIGLDGRPYSRW